MVTAQNNYAPITTKVGECPTKPQTWKEWRFTCETASSSSYVVYYVYLNPMPNEGDVIVGDGKIRQRTSLAVSFWAYTKLFLLHLTR